MTNRNAFLHLEITTDKLNSEVELHVRYPSGETAFALDALNRAYAEAHEKIEAGALVTPTTPPATPTHPKVLVDAAGDRWDHVGEGLFRYQSEVRDRAGIASRYGVAQAFH